MSVQLFAEPFDPWQALAQHQNRLGATQAKAGATAVFVGTMRDFNEDDDVIAMTLEHYPGMTERVLGDLVTQAEQKFQLVSALVAHRVGELRPGDPIVLTAAWSAHRNAALEACRFLIEHLKHQAPFWKKETLNDGSTRWVERNTTG